MALAAGAGPATVTKNHKKSSPATLLPPFSPPILDAFAPFFPSPSHALYEQIFRESTAPVETKLDIFGYFSRKWLEMGATGTLSTQNLM